MLSLVIPVVNEGKNIAPLYKELVTVLKKLKKSYEIIFVNDGSRDNTQQVIEFLYHRDPKHIHAIQFRNNFGKASALHAGFQSARGDPILTLDGDLQDDPKEIPRFLKKLEEGYDLISGWKINRKDSFIKNISSKFFNIITKWVSGITLHDFNCGMKAYKAEVAKGLPLYGELHRYIPVLAGAQGYRITEIAIHHRKRQAGKSHYTAQRFLHGFLDLLTVVLLTRFRARPLHFFAYLGLLFFSLGFFTALYLTWVKFIGHESIGERPLLLFSVMLMIMGVQISITGLVGEQITTAVQKPNQHYVVKKTLK